MNAAPSRPSLPPTLVLLVGILALSTGSILVRKTLVYAPPLVIATYRMIFASLFLLPVVLRGHREELRNLSRKDLRLGLLSGLFFGVHLAAWITSLQFTSVASSVALVSTTPLWVAVLSPFTLREPLQRQTLVGMAITLMGAVMVGLSDSCSWQVQGLSCPPMETFFGGKAIIGDLLAILGAVVAACYLLIGRNLRQRFSLVGYIFVMYGMSAVALIGFTIGAGYSLVGYPSQAFILFAALALVPQLIGHSSFNWALRYLPTALVSIGLLGEPVGSTMLAYLILEEVPSTFKLIGAGFILVGLVVASRTQPD
ncbi:MAG: DMT family transporter [Chloroflexota bacterium]